MVSGFTLAPAATNVMIGKVRAEREPGHDLPRVLLRSPRSFISCVNRPNKCLRIRPKCCLTPNLGIFTPSCSQYQGLPRHRAFPCFNSGVCGQGSLPRLAVVPVRSPSRHESRVFGPKSSQIGPVENSKPFSAASSEDFWESVFCPRIKRYSHPIGIPHLLYCHTRHWRFLLTRKGAQYERCGIKALRHAL
jgi:hypothetical protein